MNLDAGAMRTTIRRGAVLLLVVATLPLAAAAPAAARQPTFRELADARDMIFGSAAEYPALSTNLGGKYRTVLSRQFNALTPGNEMKWDTIHPQPGVYDFTKADALVAFAQAHGMKVRGHTLVWYSQNPPWLSSFTGTRDDWIALLQNHIATVVGHYRGEIAQWDVVNEPFNADGSLRDNVWEQPIGSDYIRIAFEAARAADPAALLYLNEYGAEGVGPKSDALFAFVSDLVDQGVPIDGIGLESHYADVACTACASNMAGNMARLASIGLDVAITELDVRIHLPASAADLQTQADLYRGFVGACLAAPNCHTVTVWGFTDADSWIPQFFPGFGAATMFDENFRPKPAAAAVRSALAG